MPHAFRPQRPLRPNRTRGLLALGSVVLCALAGVSACSTVAGHPEPTAAEQPVGQPAGQPATDQNPEAAQNPAAAQQLSDSPLADALYRCIVARGWNVKITPEGGIVAGSDTIPKAQYELYLADTWSCNTEVKAQFPVDDNQKHLLYAAEVAERTCLIRAGYSVPDPPTLQTFLDTYDSAPWSAMASSSLAAISQSMSDDAWAAINHACPQPVPGALK
ncbi:hypothetical protein [Subtercola sp. RTI3]|uniref:hypothetical protein n=1 Tax=Subtercola sp. RTI3 TaxID=3048639 RepID=UPI002B22BF51|nr:hypothetical protein [Subtercola sp. RTI3]MEA9986008.1 hypothetical protein [Subtercola sp. RTI3]